MPPVLDAIEVIKHVSSNLVLLPGSEQYNEITKSNLSELGRELKPACFLVPSSASEVSQILKILGSFSEDIKLVISGAGQQATPGVANIEDGITIHLQNLRGVELNTERKTVSVAAGERWGNVYDAVMAAGLGVVGNRQSSGGIGGDEVQGGLSSYSYARGLVCDNVVNYEIVLSNGEIVNANAERNKDLWIALGSGPNNFGIITRVDLPVLRVGE